MAELYLGKARSDLNFFVHADFANSIDFFVQNITEGDILKYFKLGLLKFLNFNNQKKSAELAKSAPKKNRGKLGVIHMRETKTIAN